MTTGVRVTKMTQNVNELKRKFQEEQIPFG